LSQIRDLARSVKDLQAQVASTLTYNPGPAYQPPQPQVQSFQPQIQPPRPPLQRPRPPIQQQPVPVTYPNSLPIRNTRFQNANTNRAPNSTLCWFCDTDGTHHVGMRNCPDAQAMVQQGLIKYSLDGRLVKADGSALPRGIQGKGGYKQAIINEINYYKERNMKAVGACSIIDSEGNSPFTVQSYAIAGDQHWSSPAKGTQPEQHRTAYLPKHQVTVEIPRRFGPLNPANKFKPPAEILPSARKVPSAPKVPRQESTMPRHPPGILPASVLKDNAPANALIEPIDIEIDRPERHIPKPPAAYRFTTEYQEACDENKVVHDILDQKIEISLGDFLGTAVGPAKILASGLKLKREYTGKSREPFVTNTGSLGVPHHDSDSESEEDEVPMNSLADRFCSSQTYQTNRVQATVPNKLLAMATGKILIKVTGQNGTYELLALLDSGSEINLISKDTADRLNLPMNMEGSQWSLQGITSHPENLLGCCHDVQVEIGGRYFNHHFFVKNGTFNDHNILLGQTWLSDYASHLTYTMDSDGKRIMTLQIQDLESQEPSTITLQAQLNGNRQQTKLVNNITVTSPVQRNATPVSQQQDLYQFYKIDATPSKLSLSGDSPFIPSIGRDLSQAL